MLQNEDFQKHGREIDELALANGLHRSSLGNFWRWMGAVKYPQDGNVMSLARIREVKHEIKLLVEEYYQSRLKEVRARRLRELEEKRRANTLCRDCHAKGDRVSMTPRPLRLSERVDAAGRFPGDSGVIDASSLPETEWTCPKCGRKDKE